MDYQARLLGTAKVEVISLAQTSASLFADDYDASDTQRMSDGGRRAGDHLGAGDRPGACRRWARDGSRWCRPIRSR